MRLSIGTDIERYRGVRIKCVSVPIPGEPLYECVYVVPDWVGIWHTLQGVRDYIDWRLSGRSEERPNREG
jgi:hypothetical protein